MGWIRFDNASADTAGFDKINTGIEFYSAYHFNNAFRMELTYHHSNIDDRNSFSTLRIGDEGFVEGVDSETKARIWSTGIMLQNTIGNRSIEYAFGAGVSGLKIRRKIDGCTECQVDQLPSEGGPYLKAGLDIGTRGDGRLGMSLIHYASGELKNSFIIKWKF